jgi:transposase
LTIIEPLLLPEPPKSKGGRPQVADRACLTGIVFVPVAGIPWKLLRRELGYGSGMTCWRCLRDYIERGSTEHCTPGVGSERPRAIQPGQGVLCWRVVLEMSEK